MTKQGAVPRISRVMRRVGHTVLDLSDSANLYLTATQGRWFEAVLADASYEESVARPLALAAHALPYLLSELAPAVGGKPLTVVDCGPATAEESIRKLRALEKVVAIRQYIAVDVNSRLLTKVEAGVRAELGFPVSTVRKRFEELDGLVLRKHSEGEVLLLFGSTGMNYEPTGLMKLMRRLCVPGTFISFESLLRNGKVLASREYQSDEVIRFAFGPLWLLGATLDQFDFRLLPTRDRLRLEFRARRPISLDHPSVPNLREGDRVWTAFSRRPTLAEYQSEVSRITGRFDTFVVEGQVVASIGQVSEDAQ